MISLEALLERERGATAHLLELLRQEHRALASRDMAELDRIVCKKSQQVAELEALGRDRDTILKTRGLDAGREGIESWLRQRSNSAAIRLWEELQNLLICSRQQNQINGGMVEISRRYTQRALSLLQGQPLEQETYGPTGVSGPAIRSSLYTAI